MTSPGSPESSTPLSGFFAATHLRVDRLEGCAMGFSAAPQEILYYFHLQKASPNRVTYATSFRVDIRPRTR